MPDREKVIKGLECCVAYDYKCNDCPYQDDGGAEDGCYSDELKADALALLKAQEPRVMAGAELTDAELIEEIRKAPLVLKPNVDAIPVEWLDDRIYDMKRAPLYRRYAEMLLMEWLQEQKEQEAQNG